VAHHVADDQPGPFPGQRDDVIPVAAGVGACRRQAPPGDLELPGRHPADGPAGWRQDLRDRSAAHQRQRAGESGAGAAGEVRGGVRVGVAERRSGGGARQNQEAGRRAPDDHRRGQE